MIFVGNNIVPSNFNCTQNMMFITRHIIKEYGKYAFGDEKISKISGIGKNRSVQENVLSGYLLGLGLNTLGSETRCGLFSTTGASKLNMGI